MDQNNEHYNVFKALSKLQRCIFVMNTGLFHSNSRWKPDTTDKWMRSLRASCYYVISTIDEYLDDTDKERTEL